MEQTTIDVAEASATDAEPERVEELGRLEWDLGDAAEVAKDYPVLLTTAYY